MRFGVFAPGLWGSGTDEEGRSAPRSIRNSDEFSSFPIERMFPNQEDGQIVEFFFPFGTSITA